MHFIRRDIDTGLRATCARLLPAIARDVRRLLPDWPEASHVELRPLLVDGSHAMATVEAPEWGGRRLFLKGPRRAERIVRGLETEFRLLTEIGPAIAARDAALRCPRVFAHYEDPEALLMEFVDGQVMQPVWFGLGRAARRADLPRIVTLCGTWLGHFHLLTGGSTVENPFEWAVGAWEEPQTAAVLLRTVGPERAAHLGAAIRTLAERHRDLRRRPCRTHGNFLPMHTFVEGGGICVFDLESSEPGFAYDDLGTFLAYPEMVVPWRRALGLRRLGARSYRSLLLGAYEATTAPLDETDRLLLGIAEVLAMTRFVLHTEPGAGRTPSIKGVLLRPFRRRVLGRGCRRLAAMLGGG